MTTAVEQYKMRGLLRQPPSAFAEHGAWVELKAGLNQATRVLGMLRAQVTQEQFKPDQFNRLGEEADMVDASECV